MLTSHLCYGIGTPSIDRHRFINYVTNRHTSKSRNMWYFNRRASDTTRFVFKDGSFLRVTETTSLYYIQFIEIRVSMALEITCSLLSTENLASLGTTVTQACFEAF